MNPRDVEAKSKQLDLEALRLLAVRAAICGGKLAASHPASRVQKKSGGKGLLTELDTAAEQAIVELLQKESEFAILGEEKGLQHGDNPAAVWVVDPIDGTTNLARGLPCFCTSVALCRGSQPLVGAVYDPLRDECFSAADGMGAYLNDQPIRVSEISDPAAGVLFFNHGYQQDDRQRAAEVVERFIGEWYIRKLGSTALELAYLACGRADAFLCSGDEFWDFAAGILLVLEAGGEVCDWCGESWEGRNSFIAASNGLLAEPLADMIADLQPAYLNEPITEV